MPVSKKLCKYVITLKLALQLKSCYSISNYVFDHLEWNSKLSLCNIFERQTADKFNEQGSGEQNVLFAQARVGEHKTLCSISRKACNFSS